jgi:hypothetical protein
VDGKEPPIRRFPELKAAARGLRRRRPAQVLALGAALIVVAALLVPLALAERQQISQAIAGAPPPAAPAPASRPRTAPSPHRPTRAGATPATATLTIASDAKTVPVPSSFFGISTEYRALPLFERNMPVFERMLSLLHVQGDGPLILRIGGDSADESFWRPPWRRMPKWAFELTPSFLSRLAALVRRDRVRLIVDLNLVTESPLLAAAWARAAETSLPRGSIVGFEIGNEPDLYSRRYWIAWMARSPFDVRALPPELTPSMYVQDFAAYASVLGENAPDIPLVGPAVARPRIGLPFISALIEDQRPELGMVTAHLYPYSGCVPRRSPSYATVPRVLSRQAVSAFRTDIAAAVALAHASGLRFRLTEFNSVTCGGKPGVSDTFATALWAPDALFTALRAGADGANLHVRPNAINGAFSITRGGLEPRPLLYGLMLFNRTLGPEARLVRVRLSGARSLNLSAWAVRVRGELLHVLLIDKGSRTVRVHLRVPASGSATVERLLAPSPYSRAGAVTLNGQQLNWAGAWTGTPRTERIVPGARGYTVTVPRRSAALISVMLRGAARRAARRFSEHHRLSEHHRRVAVAQHAILAVRLHGAGQH